MNIFKKIIFRVIWVYEIILIHLNNMILENKSINNDSIVLVRLDAIGDFIIWLDAAKEIRRLYDKRIVLVCNKAYFEMANEINYFDQIVPLDISKYSKNKNIIYRLKMRNFIRNIKCETLIQAVYSRTIYIDSVVSLISAKRKITIDGDCSNMPKWVKKNTDKIYDEIIITTNDNIMEIQRNSLFIKKLVNNDFQSSLPELPTFNINQDIIPKKNYFIIFPGGSIVEKQWEIDRFVQISKYITNKFDWVCCICGGANETKLSKEFIKNAKNFFEIYDLVGKTKLVEVAEVIRNAKLIISNDTSGIHFAAAVKTPSVCIVGGWHYGRFLPYEIDNSKEFDFLPRVACKKMSCYQCGQKKFTKECLDSLKEHGKYKCIQDISVDYVIKEVDIILNCFKDEL